MDRLDHLENQSIGIIREAYASVRNLGMLWSVGKDSTVLLRLAQKAFFGHVPIPLIHIDTSFKIPEMIKFRDQLVKKWKLQLMVGKNEDALEAARTFPDGNEDRLVCCRALKTVPLRGIVEGSYPRLVFNHERGAFDRQETGEPFGGLLLGIRADEEGTRSKERIFSPRSPDNNWAVTDQPPELWGYYNTIFPAGAHVRVHPLLDWTELDVWQYIRREKIPVVKLYFNQGNGTRYRSLGCGPCTAPIRSKAKNVAEIIAELQHGALMRVPERAGRAQDREDGGTLERLRKDGYM